MRQYHVHVKFVQPILGTSSADPAIHERFIASKAPDAPSLKEEVEALGADAVEERGTTIFPKRPDGTPFLWDYQIKGFFKDACGGMRRATGSKSAKLRAYKKEIDTTVFVNQRNVVLRVPEGEPVRVLQRPLRAQTAQGERVALASSEMLPAGTTCDFDLTLLNDDTTQYVLEWLAYGRLRGIGQWRNAGYGAFQCRVENADGRELFSNLDD